jgi:sigma-54 dependent transcriptional regulator, acetoin dehydrogenase operon transcriptional activator AcoR
MQDIPLQDLYTRDYFRGVGRAWERFLSACSIDGIGVRDVVLESWRRCVEQGVDPRRSAATVSVAGDALDGLFRANDALYQAIKICVAPAVRHLAGTRTVLITSDARGTLLTADGDPPLGDQMIANRIVPGACWGEGGGGTNAVGTALTLGRPTQIHAQEHFCEAGKPWSCNAALIRDPFDRRILGAVDVTGPNEMLVMHATAFVATLVARIEAHVLARETVERCRLIEAFYEQTAPGEAVILCDARGRIVKATPAVGKSLVMHGTKATLTADAQIRGLSGETLEREDFCALPEWLKPEWLVPLRSGGRCTGALLRLPMSPRAPKPASTVPLSPGFRRMADASPSLEPMLRQAECFARRKVPILLEGETGTGKDLLAQSIHAAGPTASGPFLALNCAALPRELLASELFGYADGAFTGARRGGAKGKFEQAHGGTLFLDEIGDMPLDLQPYLLRVLEENVVWRLGDGSPRPVDVRVIAATNRALSREIADARFRADLYYRLNVASLLLPALRDRVADIPSLAEHLLRRITAAMGREFRIGTDVMQVFLLYSWPGNVRELHNALERLALLATDEVLRARHLPAAMQSAAAGDRAAPEVAGTTLKSAEQLMIFAAIRRERGNCSRAARALGISRATLYRRLSVYGPETLRETRPA